ncbi:cold-shock protein [Camelimonas lactis]|uniref:cold-shock protein n=1 Tax=Camelimonas lactis TaxID=659006 RepID=UPI001404EF3E
MFTGVIQFYNPLKGCGYIQPDDGSTAVFVSSDDIARSGISPVFPGKRVRFTLASPALPSAGAHSMKTSPKSAGC